MNYDKYASNSFFKLINHNALKMKNVQTKRNINMVKENIGKKQKNNYKKWFINPTTRNYISDNRLKKIQMRQQKRKPITNYATK